MITVNDKNAMGMEKQATCRAYIAFSTREGVKCFVRKGIMVHTPSAGLLADATRCADPIKDSLAVYVTLAIAVKT